MISMTQAYREAAVANAANATPALAAVARISYYRFNSYST